MRDLETSRGGHGPLGAVAPNNNNNNNNNNRYCGISKYKLTELSPTTNQTLKSVIMKREHVC